MRLPPLSRELVRRIDRRAIDEFKIPGIVLMENAGRATATWLTELGVAGEVVVCCGKGNNGGDGYVIARHLDACGHAVHVLLTCDPLELSGDSLINFQIVQHSGIPWTRWEPQVHTPAVVRLIHSATWVVDGLLGTGISGAVHQPLVSAIEQINASGARRLAIDIPSGLDCDAGRPLGIAVRADYTATFVATKLGFNVPGALEYTGLVKVFDIGICRRLLQEYAGRS
jgi:NAD(P)H-hydrate epimerase